MRRSLGNLGLATLLSIVGSVLILNWLVNEDATKSFLVQTSVDTGSSVKQLDIEFKDSSILLNVQLNKPMSCKEVFSALDISDLPMKGKIYSPICTTVKPELVVVTYREKIMI